MKERLMMCLFCTDTAGIIESMKQTIERLTKTQIALVETLAKKTRSENRRLVGLHKRQGCQINALQGQKERLERVVEAQARRLKGPVIQVRFAQFCETCRAICEEMDFDWYEIACSAEVGGVKLIEK